MFCTNNQIPVENDMKFIHKNLFPHSNGYYTGHGCYGNISPETLFWALNNKNKIGLVQGIVRDNLIINYTLEQEFINNNTIYTNDLCKKI